MSYKTIFDTKKSQNFSGGSDSIIALMFYKIVSENSIGFQRWDTLVNRYINDPRNSIPNNDKDRSSERGNLRKELVKERMTWKVFCKGMRLLNFPRFDLRITVYHNDITKKITMHTLEVNLGEIVREDNEGNEIKDDVKETITYRAKDNYYKSSEKTGDELLW